MWSASDPMYRVPAQLSLDPVLTLESLRQPGNERLFVHSRWKGNAAPRAQGYDDSLSALVHRGDRIHAMNLVEAAIRHIRRIMSDVKTGLGRVINPKTAPSRRFISTWTFRSGSTSFRVYARMVPPRSQKRDGAPGSRSVAWALCSACCAECAKVNEKGVSATEKQAALDSKHRRSCWDRKEIAIVT